MLSESTIASSRGLAYTLTSSGYKLGVKTGTPLQLIMGEQAPMFVGMNLLEVSQEDVEKEMNASAHTQTLGMANHTAAQKQFANLIRSQVERSMQFASGEVNPLINEIIDGSEKMVAEIRNSNSLLRDIVMCKLNSIFANDFLLQQIDPHKYRRVEPSVIQGELTKRLLSVSSEQRLEAMKTSSASLNASIDRLNEDVNLPELLDYGFSAVDVSDPYNQNGLLAKYLFLRGVHLGRLDVLGKDAFSTGERIAISNMIAYYANKLTQVIAVADSHARSNRIVLTANGDQVKVIEKNYLEFLRKDGSIEALLGYVATNSNELDNLWANPDMFVKRYEAAKRSKDSVTSAEVNGEVERYTKHVLTSYINNEMELEDRPDAHARLAKAAKENPFYGNVDIDDYVRKVVCMTIAEHTDAYAYLNALDEQFKIDPEMHIKEAKVKAAVTLVGRYLSGQLTVEKVED